MYKQPNKCVLGAEILKEELRFDFSLEAVLVELRHNMRDASTEH